MPSKEYYLEQIDKELAGARTALKAGNDGKARVCVRRAVGQAIAWFLSKNPKQGWGVDAMTQLNSLKLDPDFPSDVRDAAVRLTTKISDQFTYPFSTNPLSDGTVIIDFIRTKMGSDVA